MSQGDLSGVRHRCLEIEVTVQVTIVQQYANRGQVSKKLGRGEAQRPVGASVHFPESYPQWPRARTHPREPRWFLL